MVLTLLLESKQNINDRKADASIKNIVVMQNKDRRTNYKVLICKIWEIKFVAALISSLCRF